MIKNVNWVVIDIIYFWVKGFDSFVYYSWSCMNGVCSWKGIIFSVIY